jgi:hypothetical protein
VCPPDTPTAKAAVERHFLTLKSFIRDAVESVLPVDPQWDPEQMLKTLEIATAVFATMYHLIPQDGIDGKSPAERVMDFDPVRACARQAALFQHALNNEPSDEYVRHIHRYFQFPWEEKETVGMLREFPTRVLRQLLEQEKKHLGPPFPETIHHPLEFLAARAREIRNKLYTAFFVEEWRKVDTEERRKREEDELREEREHPEVYVDGMLQALITSVRNRHGVSMTVRYMQEVLGNLAATMGSFFEHEIQRLKRLAATLCENDHVVAKVVALLDDIAVRAQPP